MYITLSLVLTSANLSNVDTIFLSWVHSVLLVRTCKRGVSTLRDWRVSECRACLKVTLLVTRIPSLQSCTGYS